MKTSTIRTLAVMALFVTSIGNLFAGKTVIVNGIHYDENNAKVVGAEQVKGTLSIPERVVINGEEMTVTEIADEAFMKRKDIRQVEFPKTLKSIGEYAFARCYNLESVTLPDSLESLGGDGLSILLQTRISLVWRQIKDNFRKLL